MKQPPDVLPMAEQHFSAKLSRRKMETTIFLLMQGCAKMLAR
jgi:hypothetical protein